MAASAVAELGVVMSASGFSPSRRVIKGALHNFLGTVVSRYSDFDGYWVFGFLVEGMDTITIDLLGIGPDSADATPSAVVQRLAAQKFIEQIAKAGLPIGWIRKAHLIITKSADTRLGFVNGWSSSGHDLKLSAQAVTDLGRTYESEESIFVAPHDPKVESRSPRDGRAIG